ncbi:MAG: 1-deoxy-D-xylulose-5-phosphate reductoisomerase [Planctomycetales bacterium]|nr:1-deoxy-D-xylulose-5-phosphate reductoisomerase [Planctomycetales bacterium]
MHSAPRNIAIFGSTGSIGRNALEVVEAAQDRFRVAALSAHSRLDELVEQARRWQPDWIIATDPVAAARFAPPSDLAGQWLVGPEPLVEIAAHATIDTVVAAIVGSAGLPSTLAAIEAGKRIALANKETMVVAGELAVRRAAETGAEILPVDSEHSAIFQALRAGSVAEVKRILLTASGGPFRTWTTEQMEQATLDQALAHPNWSMGAKITIDSATMMNKALEVIEARWLFGIDAERIEVLVHPQSIVHSLVEYVDGNVLAQLGAPDMKIPIQYALTFPERAAGPTLPLDLCRIGSLTFEAPDYDRFPALRLGSEVARRGGTTGVVLNAANEIAVERFQRHEIRFTQIAQACRTILDAHDYEPQPTLETLMRLDSWAREETRKWTSV